LERVVALIPPLQLRLDRIAEVRGSRKPLAGTLRPIIDLADFCSYPGLANEFDGGQEIIQEGVQGTVDGCEGRQFCGGVEAGVADRVPDALEVFLFDETIVIFLVVSGPGKGDAVGTVPGEEGMIYKFGTVIAVDAQKGKQEAGFDVRKDLQDPFVGFIEEGRSSRTKVRTRLE
jgi:hypothetical protein